MLYNEEYGLLDEKEAFDNQIMQKILPCIQGSAEKICKMLRRYEDDDFTSNKTLLWLSKHPDRIKRSEGKNLVKSALGVQKKITYDTVENQFVKFMLITTVKRLSKFRLIYVSSFKYSEKSADLEVIKNIDTMVSKINREFDNPIFSECPC